MMTSPEESDLAEHPLVTSIRRQTQQQERAVLNAILTAGVDQGWLLRPPVDDLVTDSTVVDALLAAMTGRSQAWPDCEDPWRDRMPPVPRDLGVVPAWVVVSQRCDLIRGYVLEPVVEVAPVRRITDKGEARAARVNSTRLIAIASDENGTLVADMRSRAWLPKCLLPSAPGSHPTIADPVEHKRLRHRLGGRYWRDAVPDDLREAFAIPLSKAFSKGARNRLLRHFSQLLGQRVGDHVLVLAIIGPNSEEEAALLDWDEAVAELNRLAPDAGAVLHPDSQALSEVDLSVSDWLDSFKFDFDNLSYGSGAVAEHESPPM